MCCSPFWHREIGHQDQWEPEIIKIPSGKNLPLHCALLQKLLSSELLFLCEVGGQGIGTITQEKRGDSDGRFCGCSCKKGQNLSYKKGLCSYALLHPHVPFIECINLVSFGKRVTKSDVVDKVLHADLWILSCPSEPSDLLSVMCWKHSTSFLSFVWCVWGPTHSGMETTSCSVCAAALLHAVWSLSMGI